MQLNSKFHILVDCGSPPAPVNGDVMFDSTSEGSVANYSCNFGFRLDGNNQRQCQSTATWSGTVPTCISEYLYSITYCTCSLLT